MLRITAIVLLGTSFMTGCAHSPDTDINTDTNNGLYGLDWDFGSTCTLDEHSNLCKINDGLPREGAPPHTEYMTNESWTGLIHDNIGNKGRSGSGFNPLMHNSYPWQRLFHTDYVGLNFEHIFNGVKADNDRAMFTPRKDPVFIGDTWCGPRPLDWPAEDSAWGITCRMMYAMDNDAIDMYFSATPTRDEFPLGYAAMMWASYMNRTLDRKIHFWGEQNGQESWLSFGDDTEDSFEIGTVRYTGVEDLPYEEGAQALNIIEHSTKHFIEPFYYGLVDGDGDLKTTNDTMAYIMMFDQAESIRLAMWNFIKDKDGKADPHSPAWDWQYIIRDPKVGETYTYHARMMYVPFVSPEDVRQRYHDWAKELESSSK